MGRLARADARSGRLPERESERARLEAKLALEAELAPKLARIMRAYGRAARAAKGQFQPFVRIGWVDLVHRALTRHYGRTVQAFRGLAVTARPDLAAVAVNGDQATALDQLARDQAERILAGVDRDLLRERLALRVPTVEPVRTGDALAPRWLKGGPPLAFEAKAGKPKYSVSMQGRGGDRTDSRAAAIANVNTQTVAEDTRWRVVDSDKGSGVVTKTWTSLLDGRERPAHHEAHGQKVGVSDTFTVMGEALRFPGDTSRGASLANVINCRCSAAYRMERPDGTSDPIAETVSVPAKRQRREGDRPGVTRPATPTTAVTLNGRTRATVALADGRLANLVQEADKLLVRVDRQTVARATIVRRGAGELSLDGLTVDDRHAERGIATLLANSAERLAAREGRRLVPPKLMADDVFAFWQRRAPALVANDVRSARDAIAKWARAEHGAAARLKFSADGETVRVLLAGDRQLVLTRADLEALGLWKPPPNP